MDMVDFPEEVFYFVVFGALGPLSTKCVCFAMVYFSFSFFFLQDESNAVVPGVIIADPSLSLPDQSGEWSCPFVPFCPHSVSLSSSGSFSSSSSSSSSSS